MPRPRPKIVSLTDAAAARVKEIMAASEKPYLRVGVKNGGCAGMEYVMEYAEAPGPFDERVEDKGVEIVVDAKAVLFTPPSILKRRGSLRVSCSRTQIRPTPAGAGRASPFSPPKRRPSPHARPWGRPISGLCPRAF